MKKLVLSSILALSTASVFAAPALMGGAPATATQATTASTVFSALGQGGLEKLVFVQKVEPGQSDDSLVKSVLTTAGAAQVKHSSADGLYTVFTSTKMSSPSAVCKVAKTEHALDGDKHLFVICAKDAPSLKSTTSFLSNSDATLGSQKAGMNVMLTQS